MGDSAQETEHYVYIHVLPSKTGDQSVRVIVPSGSIKKFFFNAYSENKKLYRNKTYKIKRGPGGEKFKCYVWYAAG